MPQDLCDINFLGISTRVNGKAGDKAMKRIRFEPLIRAGLLVSLAVASGVSYAVNEERARIDFANYCASCHGIDGTGNGPMADELKSSPTDLTILTKQNDGHFPYMRIRRVIDGSLTTGSIRAHGSGEMPVWGDVFRRQGSDISKWNDAQARILNIVDYLSTIQK